MNRKNQGNTIIWGFLLIVLGGLFLLHNFGYLDAGDFIGTFWPLILVVIGIHIILKKRQREGEESMPFQEGITVSADPGSRPNLLSEEVFNKSESNVFGDIKYRFDNRKVNSYTTSNVFGDIKLDFSSAYFEPDSSIRVTGVLGDIKILLPQNLNLEIRANCSVGSIRILDDYQDGFAKNIFYKTVAPDPKKSWVKIFASIVLGDIKITYR